LKVLIENFWRLSKTLLSMFSENLSYDEWDVSF